MTGRGSLRYNGECWAVSLVHPYKPILETLTITYWYLRREGLPHIPINIPKLPGPPNTEMPKFEITIQGVTKLLEGLNGRKAPGPDECPNLILKNAANEISPFLKIIFDQSLQTGKLPDDWVDANVAPVFKKGDRHSPANYRPISLTCVCAKLLKRMICKQIMSHFSENKILTPVQHGFRSKHSCESQLLITTVEFIQNFEGKTQTDLRF